jgi:hypothetical protein
MTIYTRAQHANSLGQLQFIVGLQIVINKYNIKNTRL